MESDARFAAVKSVTELLPSSTLSRQARCESCDWRKIDSRRNNFLCNYERLDLSLSSTELTRRIVLTSIFRAYIPMKLDTRALRYLTADDWRVLAAVCSQHLGGSHVLFD